MVSKRNVGLILILIGLAMTAERASTLNSPCSPLSKIPAPYQRNGTILPSFPRSCNIPGNFTSSYSLDFFNLLENETGVPVRSEDYFTVDVHLKCSAPYNLRLSNSSKQNLKMILFLRIEDCHVEWTDIDELGLSVYLIQLALTYIHILPIQTTDLATMILPGLDNVLDITLGINFNLTADIIHVEKALPVFSSLSAMVLRCYDSTFHTCNIEANRKIRFNTTWLQTTYPDLQTLVLIGVIPSDNFSHFHFPWNNNIRHLPLNLSRSSYLQKIYTLDVGGHGASNELRRFLDISYTDITIDRVCPINGHIDKVAFRFLRSKDPDFPYDCFWSTQNTTYIDIVGLNIDSIANGTFKDMRQLRYLSIRGTNITVLKPGIFDDLERLSFLSLANNKISYIKAGTMSKLMSLETLYLHENSINYIESDSLPTYAKLRFIDVRKNNLSALVNDSLKQPKLVMCDLEHNHINLSNIRQILNKEFDPVRLSIVDPYAYEGQPPGHYDEGYVHENRQSQINLRNNGPVYIPFDKNQWSRFEQLQLLTLLSWLQIDMGNNAIYCGAPLYNMKHWIRDNTTATWQWLRLAKYPGFSLVDEDNFASWECSAPLKEWIYNIHVKKPFMDVSDEWFMGELNNITDCPDACGCYQSPYTNTYAIYCQNRNLNEFPKHVPLPPEGTKLLVFLGKNNIESLPVAQQNQTEVHENNPIAPYSWLKRVTYLDLYQSQITADAYSLESFLRLLGEKLETLTLARNDIQSIPTSIMDFPILNLTLPDYTITCCNSRWMKYWLRNSSQIIHDNHTLKCNGHNSGLPILEMKDSQFDCLEPDPARFWAFLLLVLALIILWVCIKYADKIKILVFEKTGFKLTFRKIARDESKEFDAVLMYADQDHEWCSQTLLPHLEKGYQYKIFFKHRDGDLGAFTINQRTNSLMQSCRAIVVMSNSFISDPDCMAFFSQARSFSTDKRFVLVIQLERLRLDPANMTHRDIFNFRRTNFYVDIKKNRCLAKLCYWMPDKKSHKLPLITENLPTGLQESNAYYAFSGFDNDFNGDNLEAGSRSRQSLII